jgi:hypothetical protein
MQFETLLKAAAALPAGDVNACMNAMGAQFETVPITELAGALLVERRITPAEYAAIERDGFDFFPRSTLPPAYLSARRDMLAFGAAETTALSPEQLQPFSAESEDFCALLDAFTVYGEQAARDSDIMFRVLVEVLTPRQRRRALAFNHLAA